MRRRLAAISEGLFGEHDWFRFPMVEVLDTTVEWGYSERNFGEIKNSRLVVQRMDDGWRLRFRGGRFSQNWLSRLEIDELVALVTPGKLEIESARMHRDNGTLVMSGEVKGGVAADHATRGDLRESSIAIDAASGGACDSWMVRSAGGPRSEGPPIRRKA